MATSIETTHLILFLATLVCNHEHTRLRGTVEEKKTRAQLAHMQLFKQHKRKAQENKTRYVIAHAQVQHATQADAPCGPRRSRHYI